YRPDFLTIDVRDHEGAANLDPRWGYRPVAFDWTTVLYAQRQSQRELVARYKLRAVDPFTAVTGELRRGARQSSRAPSRSSWCHSIRATAPSTSRWRGCSSQLATPPRRSVTRRAL